jgi:hypothetical protein
LNFVTAFLVKILMQAETELAHVDPHRTIFGRTVAGRLAENGLTDLALGQGLGLAADRVFRKIRKQAVEVGGFLERGRVKNALNEHPTRIGPEILVGCDDQVGLISPNLGGLHIGTDYIWMGIEGDSPPKAPAPRE